MMLHKSLHHAINFWQKVVADENNLKRSDGCLPWSIPTRAIFFYSEYPRILWFLESVESESAEFVESLESVESMEYAVYTES